MSMKKIPLIIYMCVFLIDVIKISVYLNSILREKEKYYNKMGT